MDADALTEAERTEALKNAGSSSHAGSLIDFLYVDAEGVHTVPRVKRSHRRQFVANALTLRLFRVGEGEAVLLHHGFNGVLFDGGADVRPANPMLGMAIRSVLGKHRIRLRALVATHPHCDHLNALATLLMDDDPPCLAKNAVFYHNGEALGPWLRDSLGQRLRALSTAGRLRVEPVTATVPCDALPGVEMTHYIGPRYVPKPAYRSIVTHVRLGAASFLLTGDVYAAYEKHLVRTVGPEALRVDVLKVTHHGSEDGTSEDLLAAARPKIALASTADEAGHRVEPEVEERLRMAGTALLLDTAGVGGDIVLQADGAAFWARQGPGTLYAVSARKPAYAPPEPWEAPPAWRTHLWEGGGIGRSFGVGPPLSVVRRAPAWPLQEAQREGS